VPASSTADKFEVALNRCRRERPQRCERSGSVAVNAEGLRKARVGLIRRRVFRCAPGHRSADEGVASAARHDHDPLEQTFRHGRCEQSQHRRAAGRLAHQGHLAGIAAKRSDIGLHPS